MFASVCARRAAKSCKVWVGSTGAGVMVSKPAVEMAKSSEAVFSVTGVSVGDRLDELGDTLGESKVLIAANMLRVDGAIGGLILKLLINTIDRKPMF